MAIKFDMHSHLRVHTKIPGFQFIGLGGLVEDGWCERLRERISGDRKLFSDAATMSREALSHLCLSCHGPYTIRISWTTNSKPHSGGKSPFPTS
jgi:hypothetical protein